MNLIMSAISLRHSKFMIGLGELISPRISVITGRICLLCII